jgi:hypothetical protein
LDYSRRDRSRLAECLLQRKNSENIREQDLDRGQMKHPVAFFKSLCQFAEKKAPRVHAEL